MEKATIALILMTTLTSTLTSSETGLEEFIDSNNLFTTSVYREISKKTSNDNFLTSPFSVETILALAQSGARGETAEQLLNSLHLPHDQNKIQTAIKTLLTSLNNDDEYSLETANKIYVKAANFTVNDKFKTTATEIFGADFETIDFENAEGAADAINQWVEERTNNKIKQLVDAKSLDDRTRAILINALYFKANWTVPFKGYLTSKQDFFRNGLDPVKVDMMHDTSMRSYFESEEIGAKFVQLAFEGQDATLTVVLPNVKNGIANLENQLDKVFQQKPKFTREYVKMALPKFKIESQLDFKEILKNLGVSKVFDGDEADLSGIAGKKGDLIIDKVLQKTFIDANEKGVEAAAATYIGVGVPLSGFFPIEPPKEFIADHPFIFYITVKDVILFVGRFSNPH